MTRTVRQAAVLDTPSPSSRASGRRARRCTMSPRRRPRRQVRWALRSHAPEASPVIVESVHRLHFVVSGSEAAIEPEPAEEAHL